MEFLFTVGLCVGTIICGIEWDKHKRQQKGESYTQEVWKRLIYQGTDYGDFYEVSNFGEIRNSKTKKVRKQNINRGGYCYVVVSVGSRSCKKLWRVHKAVAETFIPNTDNKPIVNHMDGNKLNNHVDNLEWCTNQENIIHASECGLLKSRHGEECSYAKLSWEEVQYIRENYKPKDPKYGCRALGRKFSVSHVTILRVIQDKTWKLKQQDCKSCIMDYYPNGQRKWIQNPFSFGSNPKWSTTARLMLALS